MLIPKLQRAAGVKHTPGSSYSTSSMLKSLIVPNTPAFVPKDHFFHDAFSNSRHKDKQLKLCTCASGDGSEQAQTVTCPASVVERDGGEAFQG